MAEAGMVFPLRGAAGSERSTPGRGAGTWADRGAHPETDVLAPRAADHPPT